MRHLSKVVGENDSSFGGSATITGTISGRIRAELAAAGPKALVLGKSRADPPAELWRLAAGLRGSRGDPPESLQCAEHVLPLFEAHVPGDSGPREAIGVGRAWIRGEVPMTVAHDTAFVANAAGRNQPDAAKFAALAAGQAVAVAHVAAHDLGAAAYAIRAAGAAAPASEAADARASERQWQRDRIPAELRELVLEDQRARSAICWNVFDD